jgi:glycosyltransferase involved in cell wall biosynthesis
MGCSLALLVPIGAGVDGTEGGLRVVPVPVKGEPHAASWSEEPMRRLLTEFRPDVLQVEAEPWWPVARQALRLAQKVHVPAVLHATTSVAPALGLRERLRRNGALRLARGLAAPNRLALDLLHRQRSDLPAAVIPRHGIVIPTQGRPRAPRPGFVIGFVGRLVPERGLDVLLRACAQLRGDWKLAVVGTGPDQEELEGLAQRLGIGSRVTWQGGLPRQWLETFWPTVDCVVMPSRTTQRWVESAGQSVLDAMAQGLPVIGSESGVLPEIIGDAGITVPEDDPDRLALALQRLQAMPDEQARLGSAGRRRVMAEYVDDALARKTLALWTAVTTGRPLAEALPPAFHALT